jgi:hypothetical protein
VRHDAAWIADRARAIKVAMTNDMRFSRAVTDPGVAASPWREFIEAARFDFVCLRPGRFEAGMRGRSVGG